ncbi:hypothetical protein TNCV_3199201 [Trichonephila clavipes]|nr:hypothetical protein TNCV_3199201 [Trichonephila clavipes]
MIINSNLPYGNRLISVSTCDAGNAANKGKRLSIGRFVDFLDRSLLSWKTLKQICVTFTVNETEFLNIMERTKELVRLLNVIMECGDIVFFPTAQFQSTLMNDNAKQQ